MRPKNTRSEPGGCRTSYEVDAFTKRCASCGRIININQFPRIKGSRRKGPRCKVCAAQAVAS